MNESLKILFCFTLIVISISYYETNNAFGDKQTKEQMKIAFKDATKLFQKAEDLSIEMGYNCVRIDTHKNNIAMLYMIEKKFNYKYIGEITLSGRGPPAELRNLYEKQIPEL